MVEQKHSNTPNICWLPDRRRLHFQHGPIDLIVEAFGEEEEIRCAYEQAAARFRTILQELVQELPELREASGHSVRRFESPIARRMARAVEPYVPAFVTPMAAVAGAVADEILMTMTRDRQLDKAYVNNGGDIALWLSAGAEFEAGLVADIDNPDLLGRIRICEQTPVRGLATSGWRGRSFSLGIADSITVLAKRAVEADVAATMIANAVDLPDNPKISRQPAQELAPDSDLGDRLVTTSVASLSESEISLALDNGMQDAEAYYAKDLFYAAALCLGGQVRFVGEPMINPTYMAHEPKPFHQVGPADRNQYA